MIEFGTGGWRALIADGFTRANVRLLTQGLCDRMHAEGVADKGTVIGYDRRFLSREAAWWAVEVLVGNGIPVTVIDRPVPTPTIMFTVREHGCAYGLAVTASHNGALWNGIKLFTTGGRDAEMTVTDDLQAHVNALGEGDVRAVAPEDAPSSALVTVQTSINDYLDAIIATLDMDAIRNRALSVVLDPMFGVMQTSLQTILITARCQVQVINERHDTLFGGRLPSPNVETMRPLRQAVLDHGYDVGIATDGDADRLGIVDDHGDFLHPNQILVLLYNYLLTVKGWQGPVVRNMSTTHLLDRVAQAHGQRCIEVPVGFKHISSAMAEHDAVIGGESSGGLTVRGHIAGKDGIYAASLLVEMIAVMDQPLSEIYAGIVAQYGQLEMTEEGYPFTAERRAELTHRIFEAHELPTFDVPVERVGWDDGCKVYFAGGGWLTIRFSGTEPLLRVFCEQLTLAEAQRLSAVVAAWYGLT